MTLDSTLTNSTAFRALKSLVRTAADYGAGSYILKKLSTQPLYTSTGTMKGSCILRWFSALAALLLTPLAAAGNIVRQSASGSLIYKINAPHVFLQSRIIRAITATRVETALWPVIFYPVLDFLFKKIPAFAFLSGSWDELLLVFIIAAWPVQMAVRGRLSYRYTGLEVPLLIYLGVAIFLFLMRSPNISLAIEGLRVYLEYMLWFLVGSNLILNRRQFNALVKGMIAAAFLVAAYGIYQYMTGISTPDSWVDKAEGNVSRVYSIVKSPNVLGSLLLFFIPVTAAQMFNSISRRDRCIYLAALTAQLACLVLSGSRGAWLAFGASAAIFSLMYNPRLLAILAAAAAAAVNLVPSIAARLGYLFSPAYMASSSRGGRLALWTMGYNKFLYSPVLGSGFGTFGGAVAARRVPGSTYVDNFYLKTLVESGVLGLLALLWVIAEVFRHGYAAYKKISCPSLKIMAAALITGLLGVTLHNSVENIFEVPMMSTYFWFLAGVLLSLPHIEKTSKE
ncbi:MAG: O-antigen ligase family protein [Firmicutes bacterium]|nr:O-antigen ligase family protein [Bacillota bacterium]